MSIKKGSCDIKKIYYGVNQQYGGVDFLLIGGGGGAPYQGSGGGAGGFIECFNYNLTSGNHQVTIGAGGKGQVGYCCCPDKQGGNSCFDGIVAYGGGRGVPGNNNASCPGCPGGSGSGAPSGLGGGVGGAGCSGQGCSGGNTPGNRRVFQGSSGGGGAGGAGYDAVACCCYGGGGGIGKRSCMSGSYQRYAAGGGGGDIYGYGSRAYGQIKNGGFGGGGWGGRDGQSGTQACLVYTNGQTYGSGGGSAMDYGAGQCCAGFGCQGVFILRYPTACGYNMTGGTKYTCGDYTIHCFTSDGTLTVN